MKDKYCFEIPEGGSDALDLLDYCFNESTQAFLLNAGLKKGMKVLELGCGGGKMSCWIARQIGVAGQLIAIDNNQHQIDAAKKYALKQDINNIFFQCLDAYDISSLNTKFDFIYCRFILIHLSKPRSVIHSIFSLLKENGVAAIEEGVVNHGFTYPYNIAFGNERFDSRDHHEDFEGVHRDGNFGIKLYHNLYHAGLKDLTLNIVSPALIGKKEKSLLKSGFNHSKKNALENGITEIEWIEKEKQLNLLIDDDSAVIGFYQSVQVSGLKREGEK